MSFIDKIKRKGKYVKWKKKYCPLFGDNNILKVDDEAKKITTLGGYYNLAQYHKEVLQQMFFDYTWK